MATKNDPGEFDCYKNAGPDEPMFVLLARDRTAPSTIRNWVQMRKLSLENDYHDKQLIEALKCADDMEVWYYTQEE